MLMQCFSSRGEVCVGRRGRHARCKLDICQAMSTCCCPFQLLMERCAIKPPSAMFTAALMDPPPRQRRLKRLSCGLSASAKSSWRSLEGWRLPPPPALTSTGDLQNCPPSQQHLFLPGSGNRWMALWTVGTVQESGPAGWSLARTLPFCCTLAGLPESAL